MTDQQETNSTPVASDVDEFEVWLRGIHEGTELRLGQRDESDQLRLKVERFLRGEVPPIFGNNILKAAKGGIYSGQRSYFGVF